MRKVFVSGCYDILHAGHIQFFRDARALGDHLTVCFASQDVLFAHKHRLSSIPDEHKRALIAALEMVDEVVMGEGEKLGFDFVEHFLSIKPQVLAITEDSSFQDEKRALCERIGAELNILPKSPPSIKPVSTTKIIQRIRAPHQAPLRVDFAGGWLDVPRHAMEGEYIVNCAITPMVSLNQWGYRPKSGLGGSGAWALLNAEDGVESELELGVGWQDPAVIRETGCCVWRSGDRPVLDFKRNGDFLAGRMAIVWTGSEHDTPSFADIKRDYYKIAESGRLARNGVLKASIERLADGVRVYYQSQIDEGMAKLAPAESALAWKYCGGGYGGHALYLFDDPAPRDAWIADDPENRLAVEPYCR